MIRQGLSLLCALAVVARPAKPLRLPKAPSVIRSTSPPNCGHALWPQPQHFSCAKAEAEAARDMTLSPNFEVRIASNSAAQSDPALLSATTRCASDALLRWVQGTRGEDTEPVSSDDDGFEATTAAAPRQHQQLLLPPLPQLASLEVTVLTELARPNAPKGMGDDESYELVLMSGSAGVAGTDAPPSATLTAKTVWGALYGMETFSQLVTYDPSASSASPSNATTTLGAGVHVIRNATHIEIHDKPRFPWRGLMVDTANHFLPLPTLQRTVDAMAQNRLNTLHLHLVDSYSFPYDSTALPRLARQGAWAYPSLSYSADDLRALVAHARQRGVRVVPELDMPGHAYAWGLGYPEITSNTCPDALRADLGEVS